MISIVNHRLEERFSIKKILSYIFPFFLILAQYKYFSINLGYFLFYAFTAFILLKTKSFRVQPLFLLFHFSVFILVIISFIMYGTIYHATLPYYISGMLLLTLVIFTSKSIEFWSFFSVYKSLALLVTYVVIIQGLLITYFAIEISPINILPVSEEFSRLWESAPRPSGFFTEPQLFASFLMPLFLISLITSRVLLSLVLFLGILVSGSTYGVIIAAVLIVWSKASMRNFFSMHFWLVSAILIITIIGLFLYTSILDSMIKKLLMTDFSENIRVGKAIFVLLEMSFSEKIIGMQGSVGEFISKNIELFPWLLLYVQTDSQLLDYINGFFGLFVHYGIVPFVIFIVFLVSTYRKGNSFQQGMVIIILLHSLSATILFNGYYVFFFTLLFIDTPFGVSKIKFMKIRL